ncbi:hypothetical protein LEP1GSC193_0948 [Leptospira alstonii serovar Pingchang str. 80-412]|uniref:Uncharacterized protein n=2 Tax=Leptospira alstonii TaxID=28452 RepID=M6CHZ2_9LEPT|nr:hypothetical protein LEP1GSC194_0636 [Leptospira alstonii serovar Sichuan str. 79601]EQA82393.1 hypothetical protein LEP1GSC193_0948 [Leptospira alstonii serovar Pingchang str. 80-412]
MFRAELYLFSEFRPIYFREKSFEIFPLSGARKLWNFLV